MPRILVKLGKNANHFYDMVTRTSVFPGEEKKVEALNFQVKAALGVGTLVRVPMEKVDQEKAEKQAKAEKDPLMAFTRKEIMEKYYFLEEEDLATAQSKKTKIDLILFLRDVEKDYDKD